MIKILFQINENKLLIQLRKRLNTEQKNLINTNVISQNELLFSYEYIINNTKLIRQFLKELINNFNIDTLIIKESEIAPLILQVCINIPNLKNLYLPEETVLTYKIGQKIIETKTIKFVSLYSIPTFLLEMFDKYGIETVSTSEILFLSNFMKENNLDNYSSIYYKTSIHLTLPFSKEDEDDFVGFININRYLKNIYINQVQKNDLENILEVLYKNKSKSIKIYIEDDIHDLELIEYLKKMNKRNAKINNIQFKILYSKKYLEDNLMNQIHINTIKSCIYLALILVSSIVLYVFYSNYTSMQRVEKIQNNINNAIASYKDDNKETNFETDIDNPDIEMYHKKEIRKEMKPLLEINADTKGWLKVNNTNVDYPVVQATDNDYYLKRNFNKEKDNSGWVFMDYRANTTDLSRNTIIFGHNMYYSGVMFGTLYKAKYANWYTNPDNQIIEFDTLYEKYNWQIFSIYVVPNTNDYLIANFSSDKTFQEYLDLITKRSKYDFNVPVAPTDKILTLSTCTDNGKSRLVIHAVLLK